MDVLMIGLTAPKLDCGDNRTSGHRDTNKHTEHAVHGNRVRRTEQQCSNGTERYAHAPREARIPGD